MPDELLTIVRPLIMSAIAGAVGLPMARRSGLRGTGLWALAWTIGLAAISIPFAIAGAAGLPLGPLSIAIASTVLLVTTWLVNRRDNLPGEDAVKHEPFSAVLAMAAFALDVWKIAITPLWSWDHLAIWGAKARFLGTTHHVKSIAEGLHPEYPIGFPIVLHVLSGGGVPDQYVFRTIHILFLACALLLVRSLVLRYTASALHANLSCAFLAMTPMAWDTEAVGLADLPLITFAVAALILGWSELRSSAAGFALCVGFIPWIKQDGLPLAAFVIVAVVVLAHDRRMAIYAAVAALIVAVPSVFVGVGRGTSFFAGPWQVRAIDRIHHPGSVLHHLWPYLTSPAFLGLWFVVPFALVLAFIRRERRAAALLCVVIAQLIVYGFVYFASFLPPEEHIRSSFHRIASALAPLAIAGMTIAIGAPVGRRGPPRR